MMQPLQDLGFCIRKKLKKAKLCTAFCLNYPAVFGWASAGASYISNSVGKIRPFGVLSDNEKTETRKKKKLSSSGLTHATQSGRKGQRVARLGKRREMQTPTRCVALLADMPRRPQRAEGAVIKNNNKNGVSGKVEGCGSIVTRPLGDGHRWCII